ncbi:hypothetical protein F5Y16DRAFT_21914 [Xylariaceae sp. FL0255]|nr:hypothetical protein F5Y16DRAFT_21914 [Xylariaceae sp. FL0255]
MASALKQLLTPELYDFVVRAMISYERKESFDIGDSVKLIMFSPSPEKEKVPERVRPILKILSEMNMDDIVDMLLSLLPPVSHPDFPSQALGLQLILDQGSRMCLKGVEMRWIDLFFGEIASAFAWQLLKLPEDMRPSSWTRWKDIATAEYYFWVRFLLEIPIVHNESMGETAVAMTEELRIFFEEYYKTRDRFRDRPELRWDLYGFPRMLQEQGPTVPCSSAEGCFWMLCLLDVHKPPLDKFGRYLYQNWRQGRTSTAEECEWMEKVKIFDPPSQEIVDQIREDVEKGIWRPL